LSHESKDWRDEDAVTDVKDQGHCGSCWAFSSVEQVESMSRIQSVADDFIGSPQELVSCDHNQDLGCSGGLPPHAFEWMEKKPLEAEDDYPYTSGDSRHTGKCKADYSQGKVKVTSYKTISEHEQDLEHKGEKKMIKYVLGEGPLSIGVDASAWQLYDSGVMDADGCAAVTLDHAVQVVAYNGSPDDNSGPYWTVRNSWNTDWGEEGFIRLTAGENTCLIASLAVTVDVESVDAEQTPKIEEIADDLTV